MDNNNKLGIFFAGLSAVLGAFATISYKPLMMGGLPPLSIGILESMAIVLTLSIPAKIWKISELPAKSLWLLGITSILQAFGVTGFFIGLSYLNPITFTFIVKNQVVLTVLLGYFMLHERHSMPTWFFITTAIVGSLALMLSDFAIENILGVCYALNTCVCYSVKNFLMRKYKNHIPNLQSIVCCYISTFIVMSLYSQLLSIEFIVPEPLQLIQIFATGIFVVAGTVYFYQKALYYESVSLVTSIRLFSPFIVTLYFATIGGMTLDSYKQLGITLMGIGSIILFLDKNGMLERNKISKETENFNLSLKMDDDE